MAWLCGDHGNSVWDQTWRGKLKVRQSGARPLVMKRCISLYQDGNVLEIKPINLTCERIFKPENNSLQVQCLIELFV